MIDKEKLIKIINSVQDYGKKLIDCRDGVVVASVSNEQLAEHLIKELTLESLSDENIKDCYGFASKVTDGEGWASVLKEEAIKRGIELKEDTIMEDECL